jgi:hypothetical protein
MTRGRTAGTEDIHHHYRKGVAGDRRNHFEPAHIGAATTACSSSATNPTPTGSDARFVGQ